MMPEQAGLSYNTCDSHLVKFLVSVPYVWAEMLERFRPYVTQKSGHSVRM